MYLAPWNVPDPDTNTSINRTLTTLEEVMKHQHGVFQEPVFGLMLA